MDEIEITDIHGDTVVMEIDRDLIRLITCPTIGKPVWLEIDQAKDLHEKLGNAIHSVESWIG